MTQKNLKVTFSVTALVSPEEYAKTIGYPEGDPRNELNVSEMTDEDLEECICTYASEFAIWHKFFKITDRKIVNIEETDEPWDPRYPPESQAEMKIRAYITSEEPVSEPLPESDCDAVSYSLIKPSSKNDDGKYETVVLITVDQAKAREWYDEIDPEDKDTEWNGNVFESCYWGSPDCALAEDKICPGGYQDYVDFEYLSGVES